MQKFTRLAENLHTAAIHLLRGLRVEDREAPVGPTGLSALSVLYFAAPLTPSILAGVEGVRPATMSRVIARLEKQKLVEKARDRRDRRSWQLSLTPEGREVFEEARTRRLKRLEHYLGTLDGRDLAAIEAAVAPLGRLAKLLKDTE